MTPDGVPGATTQAPELVARYAARGWTLATCESLTAGLVAGEIAGVPGASAVLRGGLVTYATDLKAALAGVPKEVLARDGVISETVATAMAAGARDRCGATVGIACTGVAGPDPQEGHDPGEVWLAAVTPDSIQTRHLWLTGDRARIRAGTVRALISLAFEAVERST